MTGAGDRRGPGALRACGDRPAIRAAHVDLVDLRGHQVATVTMVTDDHAPEVVMFGGDPFLPDPAGTKPGLTYRQARVYRADAMVIEVTR